MIENSHAYLVYLKNGQSFDVISHSEERNLFVVKMRNGYEVGFPKDDLDVERTQNSLKLYEELIKTEEARAKKSKELEEIEKKQKSDFISLFSFEKRGVQLNFAEDEAMQLINFGFKNLDRFDEVLAAYTFFNDYVPSLVYTKRLRLILYGMDKGRGNGSIVTTEVQNILQDPNLLILVAVTGNEPNMLEGADVYIEQENAKVLPYNFKIPSKGERTHFWPDPPAYYWKILVNFSYQVLNLNKSAKLVIKKGNYYREFTLDFPSFR